MQPRCEHLKSLIVSEQAFKSESRDLAWPHWKSAHSLKGGQSEVARAGTTQLHTKQIVEVFTPLTFLNASCFFFPFFVVFPLLLPSLPSPLSKALLLCPRTISGHAEVALSIVCDTLGWELATSMESSSRNVGENCYVSVKDAANTESVKDCWTPFQHFLAWFWNIRPLEGV